MKKLAIIAALTWVSAVAAEDIDGIQNHGVQKLFLENPCPVVIDTIDNPPTTLEGIGKMSMAFGFLMGFEVQNPGIRGEFETILIRLRTDCARHPDKTAMALLMGYAGN